MNKGGWTAEVKIPLSQLRYGNEKEKVWGLQVTRRLFRKEERSTWQYIPQNAGVWVSGFGELNGLNNIPMHRQVEIAPYVTAQVDKYKKQPGNPYADGVDFKVTGGVDGKLAVTNDLMLDFTINPDFGQVEADPSQVRIDGFQNFFSERRPFFIESRNIFEYQLTGSAAGGDYDADLLFYSRRIGSSPHGYPNTVSGEYVKHPQSTFSSLNRKLFFFYLKTKMFSKIMVKESLLSSHGEYENFFFTVLSNNIGKFGMSRYYVDLSRNSLNYEAVKKKWINLAIDANEEISADYAYEQSHKSIDNIYFNTISKHIYEFNEAQWDTIYETAFKCPYTYGSAVFKARDLFRLKIDTIEFDDRVLCDTSQMKYSDNFKEISNGCRLYPNPSKDYFILQSFKTDSSNLTVFITNGVGTIIDKRKFDTFKQSMLISCEDYSAGLYFCLIKEDDSGICTPWATRPCRREARPTRSVASRRRVKA